MPRGKPVCEEIRSLIIKSHMDGKSGRKISEEVKIPRTTVQDIIKLFKNTGKIGLGKKTGRNCSFSAQDLRALKKIVLKNRRATAAEITLEWNLMCKSTVSVSTCTRAVKKLGYKFYKVSFQLIS